MQFLDKKITCQFPRGFATNLTTGEEGKATDPQTGPLDHHLEATRADDVLPHEIALALALTPGCRQIEDLHDPEVVRLLTTAGAHEHPPSNHEPMVKPHTVAVERHLLEDSLPEETKGLDRRLLRRGDPGLRTMMENRAMLHGVGAARAVPATYLQEIKKSGQLGEVLPPFPITTGTVVCCLQELRSRPRPRPLGRLQFARKVPLSLTAANSMPI
ncbi:hypothetical protein N7481_000524 [Penicillium waksmanii]|uniref:uncharacterized protein n=1 Tax=Penicillium waksmanii TaxID=69791 RepID=UPI002549C119|nr:uncharacterized protein N7481_000524 [Penicillium waksmanii]KAJ6000115.1 hypothetical protein N7481_000524 [Penicillium waksmanii]